MFVKVFETVLSVAWILLLVLLQAVNVEVAGTDTRQLYCIVASTEGWSFKTVIVYCLLYMAVGIARNYKTVQS
jgi:hypothetical protein